MSGWVAETLVATSLLMLLVLGVRPLVRGLFGAGAAYALWLIPALRFVLPPMAVPLNPSSVVPSGVEMVMAAGPVAPASGTWLLAVWAAGALLFAGWHLIAYRLFLRRALRGAAALSAPGVFATDAVQGPAAVGLLVRRVLVPRDFVARFSATQRDLALHHEHVHHARGDLWANAAALIMLALHWFNPLAHWAYRAFREDQEFSCDAVVIANAGAEQRAAYGEAMVKSAWGAAPVTTCPMTRSCNLKRRLKMVRTHRKSVAARIGGALSVGALALAGLSLTATGVMAQEPFPKIKTITVKEGTGPKGVADALSKELTASCGNVGDRFETNATSQQDGKPVQTTFVLCNKNGAAPTDRLVTMERVRASIAGRAEMDADKRTKILGALDGAIAKMKAEQ